MGKVSKKVHLICKVCTVHIPTHNKVQQSEYQEGTMSGFPNNRKAFVRSESADVVKDDSFKLEPVSPSDKEQFVFSRCSSTGSLNTLSSSAHNTGNLSIRQCFGAFCCELILSSDLNCNVTRQAGTQIIYTQQKTMKEAKDVMAHNSKAEGAAKRRDGIKIRDSDSLKIWYNVGSANATLLVDKIEGKNQPGNAALQVSDEVKFQVFQAVMDSLFVSFNGGMSVANFTELSACVFSWLEEHCKPQILREMVLGILQQLKNQVGSGPA
ncbi:Max-like protein X [Orchesella cincta]|uniref:Max-like protein X n=1 Tax=Orchesella cincta TaxID=48709 RepID=A0A1D2N2Z7_ORCCI|nr:Max-like protein X [Orchesella cincta]